MHIRTFAAALAVAAMVPALALADHSVADNSTDAPMSSTCSITQTLAVGSMGSGVECLQRTLITMGLLKIAKPSGYYGTATRAAVAHWQGDHGLPQTGTFGPRSLAAYNGVAYTGSTSSAHPLYAEMEASHKAMMAAFMSTSSTMSMAMPDDRKVIAVVLYNEFEPLDAIGPFEVLGQLHGYKVVTVAKKKGEVASAFGTKVVADYSFDELKHPAIIVVPGGLFGTIAASKDPATLAWLQEADKTSEYTTSVCTGAWILAAAGLLDGREASTHWTGADYLEDFGAKYTGKRYTVDGKYITAAGVSAGIDMGFKLVAMLEGDDAAKIAQLGLEYDPQPPFDAGSPAKSDPALVTIMRDMMKDHIMAANMMYGAPTTTMPAISMDHDMHTGLDVASWPQKPTVSLVVHLDSMGGWNLELETQNFRFAPEHVGGAPVVGEGHAHLYLDGVKIARVYGNWYNLSKTGIGPGVHTLRVTLNANDHSDLMINGSAIEAMASITVQ